MNNHMKALLATLAFFALWVGLAYGLDAAFGPLMSDGESMPWLVGGSVMVLGVLVTLFIPAGIYGLAWLIITDRERDRKREAETKAALDAFEKRPKEERSSQFGWSLPTEL